MARVIHQDYAWLGRQLGIELSNDKGQLSGRYEEGSDDDGTAFEGRVVRADGPVLTLALPSLTEGHVRATVIPDGPDAVWVVIDGQGHRVERVEAGARGSSGGAAAEAGLSPMTGQLVQVQVAAGEAVEEGTPLFVVEAMKMEYVVRAPFEGTVASVNANAGDQVAIGDEVVSLTPAGGGDDAS